MTTLIEPRVGAIIPVMDSMIGWLAITLTAGISLDEYLDLCRKDPRVYATAAERMLAGIGEAEVQMNLRLPGIDLQGRFVLRNRGIHLPGVRQRGSEIGMGCQGVRAQAEIVPVVADGRGEIAPLLFCNGLRQKLLGRGVLRVRQPWQYQNQSKHGGAHWPSE